MAHAECKQQRAGKRPPGEGFFAAEGPIQKLAPNCVGQLLCSRGSAGVEHRVGGVRDGAWRLELVLGLQAKAKAATMALRWRLLPLKV